MYVISSYNLSGAKKAPHSRLRGQQRYVYSLLYGFRLGTVASLYGIAGVGMVWLDLYSLANYGWSVIVTFIQC